MTPLQALENIIETFLDKDSEDIKTVRKALKTLEIIKNKEVDVSWFKYCLEYYNDTSALKRYNKNCDIEITEEEYELLKEVLL